MKKLMLLTLIFSQAAHALTLDEYLDIVKKKNRLYTSTDLSIQASNDRRESGDVVLAPTVTAAYTLTDDKTVPSTAADERKNKEYSLGVSKTFSSGTNVTVKGQVDENNYTNPYTGYNPNFSLGGLSLGLSQSLWRNFFGEATRLRHRREEAVNQNETLSLDLRRRNVLIEAESSFWDYSVAQEDLKLKEENLERARKLDRWTTGRVNNGISDRADLMNVKALASLRELELQTAQDNLKTEEVRFRENLDLAPTDPTPVVQVQMQADALVETRPDIKALMQQKNVILIDSYLAVLDAKARKLSAQELQDSLRPDLSLVGGYATSAYDATDLNARNDLTSTRYPRTYIGLSFTWQFDTSAKTAQLSAVQKDALAAQYIADKKDVEGRIAWAEHLRKYQVQQASVLTLQKIADFQKQRVRAEQDKFSKGRTVTTEVVQAETDSAEADVNYLRAKSVLKKLEASTLLFTSIQE